MDAWPHSLFVQETNEHAHAIMWWVKRVSRSRTLGWAPAPNLSQKTGTGTGTVETLFKKIFEYRYEVKNSC